MKISKKTKDPRSGRLETIAERMRTDDSIDAPENAVTWARNLFRSRVAEARPSLVERLTAVLRVDLAPGKAVYGERSAAASSVRQMLFEAGEMAVDLRLTYGKRSVDIRGQLLGTAFEQSSVRIHNDEYNAETLLSELSEFRFDGVPFGTYSLTVVADNAEIVVQDLELAK